MLIQHSPVLILHRMATIEAKSLSATQALIARNQEQMMTEKAIDRLDGRRAPTGTVPVRLDKSI